MISAKKRVLIVGAGLAGLSLYRKLDKSKFDVTVVEKRTELHNLGFAIVLIPLGVRALRELGYSDKEIDGLGKQINGIQILDKKGVPTLQVNYDSFTKRFDKYFVVTRNKLYKLLEKKLSKKDFRFGVKTTSFEQKKETVLVTFSNGSQEEFDLVVGADGIYSHVRQHIFPSIKISDTGLMFMWAWVPRKKNIIPEGAVCMDSPKGGFGFFDSGEPSRVCLYFYKKVRRAISQKYLPSEYKNIWQNLLKDFAEPAASILQILPPGEEMHRHQDCHMQVEKLYKDSMVLIGDAAHVRTVFAGSGSGSALEEGVTLGMYLNEETNIKKAIQKFNSVQRTRGKDIVLANLGKKWPKTMVKYLSSSPLFLKKK